MCTGASFNISKNRMMLMFVFVERKRERDKKT